MRLFSRWLLILPLATLLGCAAGVYKVHPGAGGYVSGAVPSSSQIYDSQEYDALVAANAAIQQIQADYLAGKIPAAAMPAVRSAANIATQAYNAAQAQWLAFDQALKAGASPSQAALSSAIAGMTQAVSDLTKVKQGGGQ